MCVWRGRGQTCMWRTLKKEKTLKVSKLGPEVLFNKKESYGSEKKPHWSLLPESFTHFFITQLGCAIITSLQGFPFETFYSFFSLHSLYTPTPSTSGVWYGLPQVWRELRPQTSLYLRNGMGSFISGEKILFPEQCINKRLMFVSITYRALVLVQLGNKF